MRLLLELRVLDDEGDDENENGVGDEEENLELVPEVALAPALALPVLLGVGDAGLRVSVEQLLTVGHGGRVKSVTDGNGEGGAANQPEHGREHGVGQKVDELVLSRVVVHESANSAESDGGNDEQDVEQVLVGRAVPENDLQAAENVGTVSTVTLLDIALNRTRSGESHGLTAEPAGKKERDQDGLCVVWSHPEHRTTVTESKSVTRRKEVDVFLEAHQEERDESETNLPAKLVVVRVCDQSTTRNQDDGNGENRDDEENLEESIDGENETRKTLVESHVSADITVKTEALLESGLERTESPASTLLQMAGVRIRDGTELKTLVDVSSLETSAEELRTSESVLSESTGRPATNGFESRTTNHVTRASAPCDTQGVLDGLHDVNEGVERLNKHVVVGDVVEKLGRTGEGSLGVADTMREKSTKPLLLRNHISIESSDVFARATGKLGNEVSATDQVTGLGVMRLALDLDTSEVVGVGVLVAQIFHGFLQFRVGTIVENNNAEAVLGVVDIAGGAGSVNDNVNVFLAASDESVDSGDCLANQSKLRSLATLECEHGVHLMEERGNWRLVRNCEKSDPAKILNLRATRNSAAMKNQAIA